MTDKMNLLIDELNKATESYEIGQPVMSDKEWDDKYFELQAMERVFNTRLPHSPTQKVNYTELPNLTKVKHTHLMLSLDKTKNIEDIEKMTKKGSMIAMLKLDGLSCSIRYEDGVLVKAVTRGDGEVGEDITHNALVVRNLPKRIAHKESLEIDGEIICRYSDFESFANEYKNPRNFASGSIRLLDSKESHARKLSFVAWDVVSGLTEDDLLSRLLTVQSLGLTVVPLKKVSSSEEIGLAVVTLTQPEYKDFPTDGLVFKYQSKAFGDSLGKTSHHFNNAIAYKLYDEEYESTLTGIEWNMGRTGVLTPIALFDPIDIDGSTVSRAGLHNVSIMNALGVKRVGQRVSVFKANSIIPQIAKVLDEGEGDLLVLPSVCPVCKGETVIKNTTGVETLVCSNPDCSGKLLNQLNHFAGKKGLDIKGLSLMTLEKLMDWGWVNNKKDLFALVQHKEEWSKKVGFGTKSVENILNAIENSKKCVWTKFVSALGISLVGTTVSKDLGKKFNSYEEFRVAVDKGFNFTSLPNFGYELNKSILNFDYSEADDIAKLLTFEQEKEEIVEQKGNSLEGKIFCLSGKFPMFKTKAKISEVIKASGGLPVDKWQKHRPPHFLISNDKNSGTKKVQEAVSANVPVLTEEEFVNLFNICI